MLPIFFICSFVSIVIFSAAFMLSVKVLFITSDLLSTSSANLRFLSIADASSFMFTDSSPIWLVMPSTSCFISFADCEESSASFPTSPATTANPLPASPALAASIAAFNASSCVWAAMLSTASVIVSIALILLSRLSKASSTFLLYSLDSCILNFISENLPKLSSIVPFVSFAILRLVSAFSLISSAPFVKSCTISIMLWVYAA